MWRIRQKIIVRHPSRNHFSATLTRRTFRSTPAACRNTLRVTKRKRWSYLHKESINDWALSKSLANLRRSTNFSSCIVLNVWLRGLRNSRRHDHRCHNQIHKLFCFQLLSRNIGWKTCRQHCVTMETRGDDPRKSTHWLPRLQNPFRWNASKSRPHPWISYESVHHFFVLINDTS